MKKEKKIKTELDYLKSIDGSLLMVIILLMGVIAIAAIATVGIYSNVDVTANAAAENLLSEAVEISVESGEQTMGVEIIELNLELTVGNTYAILYSIDGGEKLTITNTCFDETAENNEATSIGTLGENITKLNDTTYLYIAQDYKFDAVNNIQEAAEGYASFLVTKSDSVACLVTVWGIYEGTEVGAPAPAPGDGESIDVENAAGSESLSAGTIVENITGSFTTFLTGTGQGIVDFFDTIFTNGEGGISILGIVALSMMGLGIATGIIRYLLAKAS